MKPFGWAFIGAGSIASSVARRVFKKSGAHKLVGVYNRTFSRAQALAKNYGAKTYASIDEAVSDESVEGVYINVTNNAHYTLAMEVLESGKPVLLEKPLTTSARQARELFEKAKEKGVYFCEAMWTWFSPQPYAVKEVVETETLGKVTKAQISFCLPIAFSKNNRLLINSLAGGALLDLGVYPVTYAYRLFGEPKDVKAKAKFFDCDEGDASDTSYKVDVSDDIVFKYDGFDVEIYLSIKGLRGKGESLVIDFERGSLRSRGYHSGGGFKTSGGEKMKKTKNAMLLQFDKVAEEIRAGKKTSDHVTPEDSIAVMELLDKIRDKIGLRFSFEE